jgi:hypothetical protein
MEEGQEELGESGGPGRKTGKMRLRGIKLIRKWTGRLDRK